MRVLALLQLPLLAESYLQTRAVLPVWVITYDPNREAHSAVPAIDRGVELYIVAEFYGLPILLLISSNAISNALEKEAFLLVTTSGCHSEVGAFCLQSATTFHPHQTNLQRRGIGNSSQSRW